MPITRRALPALVLAAFLGGACGSDPSPTIAPSPTGLAATTPEPAASEAPFTAAALPAFGSACSEPGYAGLIGRIEAVDPTTVRFTLCRPDGAFLARLAHPALGILDSTTIGRIAADRSAARGLSGSGPYRIAGWVAGDNVVLERVAATATPDAVPATIVLSWAPDPAARATALMDASVDAIDAPGPAELDAIATLPELDVIPRPGLATAFLAFGSGPTFAGTRVRRAISLGLDLATLTSDAFPAGSTPPTHLTPCIVVNGCGGHPWYEFNGPAAVAALTEEGFDLGATYVLHVPDQPIPGLPDPAGTATAIAAQLAANVGLTVSVDVMPLDSFRAAVDAGSLDGMYLDGVASSLPDAIGFLGPLFGDGVRTTPALRATVVRTAVQALDSIADPAARADAIAAVNDAIRSAAVIVPLAHPGSTVAAHGDVTGIAASPLGLDPLGAATPGDRPQLVFMQASEPRGAYCGDQATADAYRLCGLVAEGLYGVAPGSLVVRPALATCSPDTDARTWTCRLRAGTRFGDGMRVDAGDVLASFRAQWDTASELRRSEPGAAFAAWDELFGGTLGGG